MVIPKQQVLLMNLPSSREGLSGKCLRMYLKCALSDNNVDVQLVLIPHGRIRSIKTEKQDTMRCGWTSSERRFLSLTLSGFIIRINVSLIGLKVFDGL